MNKINLSKIDLTVNQKKIIMMGAVVFLVFLTFLILLYLPASREISNLKQELIATEQQTQGIEMLLAGSQSRDEAIRLLKEKQQYLSNKFPQKEEESLRLISEIARKMNIDVASLKPGPKAELLDESGRQIVLEGKIANYLPISLELSCYYKDLIKYLTELKIAMPAFISVYSLRIRKADRSAGKIQVNVEFNLYLLN